MNGLLMLFSLIQSVYTQVVVFIFSNWLVVIGYERFYLVISYEFFLVIISRISRLKIDGFFNRVHNSRTYLTSDLSMTWSRQKGVCVPSFRYTTILIRPLEFQVYLNWFINLCVSSMIRRNSLYVRPVLLFICVWFVRCYVSWFFSFSFYLTIIFIVFRDPVLCCLGSVTFSTGGTVSDILFHFLRLGLPETTRKISDTPVFLSISLRIISSFSCFENVTVLYELRHALLVVSFLSNMVPYTRCSRIFLFDLLSLKQ